MSLTYETPRTAGAPVVSRPAAGRKISRKTVVKLLVTAALTVYVLRQAGLGDALETLRAAEWRFVALATMLALLAMVFNVKRWQMMLEGQGGSASLVSLIRLYLIGMFVNNFVPRIGADVVRAYGASGMATSTTRSVAAVVVDRLVGAISVLLLGTGAILFSPSVIPGQMSEVLILGLAALLAILGLLLYRSPRLGFLRALVLRWANVSIFGMRLRSKVEAAIDAIRSYAGARGMIGRALLISMVANGLSILNLYLYSLAVNANLSLPEVAVVAPAILAVGLIPLSPNGIGTIELAFVVLLGTMGVDPPVALAMAILRRFVLLVLSLFGGLLYAVRRFG